MHHVAKAKNKLEFLKQSEYHIEKNTNMNRIHYLYARDLQRLLNLCNWYIQHGEDDATFRLLPNVHPTLEQQNQGRFDVYVLCFVLSHKIQCFNF